MEKQANKLKVGDIVITKDERKLKIKTIRSGIFHKTHIHIEFTNGEWSEIEKTSLIITN